MAAGGDDDYDHELMRLQERAMMGDESDLDALAAYLAAKRGRRMKRVKRRMKQAAVDDILRNPFDLPLPVFPEESLARRPQAFRDSYERIRTTFERTMAFCADVRKQYEEKGYVEMEVEVVADDEEDKVVVVTDDDEANKVGSN